VILAHAASAVGGGLRFDEATVDGMPAAQWLDGAMARLVACAELRVLPRTTVFGYYDHNFLAALQCRGEAGQVLWKIRAKRVVLATGAIERPIAFANNDLPGVMLAAAARRYMRLYGVAPGRRLVVFTNNDSAYRTAEAAHGAGIDVAAIVDFRAAPSPAAAAAERAGIDVRRGQVIVAARGRRHIEAVEVAPLGGGRANRIACDALAVSGGWNPTVHLFCQSGGRLSYDEARACFVPEFSAQAVRSAGAAAGTFALGRAFAEGAAIGADAARKAGVASPAPKIPQAADPDGAPIEALWAVPTPRGTRAWVDLLSDVTSDDVALAARENYRSVEHLKRYTTIGMAADQGKTSNVLALALLGEHTGAPVGAVGTTRFRPPYVPIRMGALAGEARGELYRPRLRLAAHDAHAAAGARFDDYGGWLRPAAYPRAGEPLDAAARRESLAVRAGCGAFDASTLGKIEVSGPDAARFLDRLYVETMSTLPVGRIRYGLMLTEHGIVFDDGVASRLGATRFLVGTTSAGAARVAEAMEEWLQGEWPELRVFVTPVTHQWGVITLTGPETRSVLHRLGTDIDLARDAFPHMAVREGRVAGMAARVQRVSFTGEISYEIAVAARHAAELFQRALAARAEPFGIEALMILRLEKGYIHVGSETDGTTVPDDLGMGRGIARKASDFVGRRSLRLPEALRSDRNQLMGLRTSEPGFVPAPGTHVALGDGGVGSDGWVTSSAFSPTLGRSVALAMVRGGRRRKGETVTLIDEGRWHRAEIVEPCSYDPGGARLHG
jgi:sarcosine oxidase subunit alpha